MSPTTRRRRKWRRIPPRFEIAIRAAYAEGDSPSSLARAYRTGRGRIIAVLARRGVPLRTAEENRRNAALRSHRFTPDEERAICAAYARTGSSGKIAWRFGTNRQTIHNILRRNGVPLYPRPPGPRPFPERMEHAIAKAYAGGTEVRNLVRTYRTTYPRIHAVLARRGVPLRTLAEIRRRAAVRRRKFTPDEERAVCATYVTEKRSLSEIAAARGVSVWTVQKILYRNSVQMRSISEGVRAHYAHLQRQFRPRRSTGSAGGTFETRLAETIARRVGVSRWTVIAVLARHGVPVRSPSEAAQARWAHTRRRRDGASRRRHDRLRAS